MTEMTIEETMQNSYRSVRERLGMAFVPKTVVVPRKLVMPAIAPPTQEYEHETKDARRIRARRKEAVAEMNAKSPVVLWSTEATQVSVTPKVDWDDGEYAENVRTINGRWREIMRQVCEKHGIGILDIRGKHRSQTVVRARHELFYRLRTETALSFPEIGRRVGNFDHSSAIAGMRRHLERVADGTAL